MKSYLTVLEYYLGNPTRRRLKDMGTNEGDDLDEDDDE
jgi:hypothetical protein